jgi:serine/threonine protein kinase
MENLKIIKTLGAGMYGTTYLAELVNSKDKKSKNEQPGSKYYALKIQHILEEDKKQDFKSQLWREMDFYKLIDKLKKDEQRFFMKLYDYEIYDKCDHKQIRPNKPKKFLERMNLLDKSTICVKMMLDYKGENSIYDQFKKEMNPKMLINFMLQICKIIHILYKNGYSHGDLNSRNIMIEKTDKKTFTLLDKKIPHNGYQLSAIDYGSVLNDKYTKYKGYRKQFTLNKARYALDEMFYATIYLTEQLPRKIEDCKKQGGTLPWEHNYNVHEKAIKSIFLNHRDFYNSIKDKYFKRYPNAEKIINMIMNYLKSEKTINELVRNEPYDYEFWQMINRVVVEFGLVYPKEAAIYWKWCNVNKEHDSSYNNLLPKKIVQDLLLATTLEDYIGILIGADA